MFIFFSLRALDLRITHLEIIVEMDLLGVTLTSQAKARLSRVLRVNPGFASSASSQIRLGKISVRNAKEVVHLQEGTDANFELSTGQPKFQFL